MTINFLDLYNECAGQPWSMFDSDAESNDDLESSLKTSINKACSYLWSLQPWIFRYKTKNIRTVIDRASYRLPLGALRRKVIDKTLKFGIKYNGKYLKYMEDYELQDEATGEPEYFYVDGNMLYIYPTPDDVYTIELSYLSLAYARNKDEEEIYKLSLDKDIAALVDKYAINKPTTDEEIALAKQGQFNNPITDSNSTATAANIMDRLRNGLSDFKAGYDDNSLNGFADGDMARRLTGNTVGKMADGTLTGGAAQTKKSIMARLGEAAGTGRRLMANPWVQAGLAGIISAADGGDIGDVAETAYKYGTAKSKSDQYYKAMHPDAKVMPVFNTFDADDYVDNDRYFADKVFERLLYVSGVPAFNRWLMFHSVDNFQKFCHWDKKED